MLRRVLTCLALFACCTMLQAADIVVVVRSDSEIGILERSDVINIFLGRFRKLQSGGQVEPLDLPAHSSECEHFYQRLIGKTPAEINAYWARLLFTGRVFPPRAMDSQERLLDTLLGNPRAIGYLERDKVDRRLRIVYEMSGP